MTEVDAALLLGTLSLLGVIVIITLIVLYVAGGGS